MWPLSTSRASGSSTWAPDPGQSVSPPPVAGAQVTACDINPRAVVLARDNARRNGVDMEILESDLFSSLGGRMFDLICFNLPFYPGQPATPFEAAFFGGPAFETISAFAAGCRGALAPGGTVAVIISEDSGHDRIVSLFTGAGFLPIDDRAARVFQHLVARGSAARSAPTATS